MLLDHLQVLRVVACSFTSEPDWQLVDRSSAATCRARARRLMHDLDKLEASRRFWAERLAEGQHRAFLLLARGPASFARDVLALLRGPRGRRERRAEASLAASDQIERRAFVLRLLRERLCAALARVNDGAAGLAAAVEPHLPAAAPVLATAGSAGARGAPGGGAGVAGNGGGGGAGGAAAPPAPRPHAGDGAPAAAALEAGVQRELLAAAGAAAGRCAADVAGAVEAAQAAVRELAGAAPPPPEPGGVALLRAAARALRRLRAGVAWQARRGALGTRVAMPCVATTGARCMPGSKSLAPFWGGNLLKNRAVGCDREVVRQGVGHRRLALSLHACLQDIMSYLDPTT